MVVRRERENSAPAATMVLMLAVALLGPLLALPFVWLLGLPLAASAAGPGMLARANTRANLRRVASVATPVMLAVSLIFTIFFGKACAEAGRRSSRRTERTTADYVLRARTARRPAAGRRRGGARDPRCPAGVGLASRRR